MSDENNEEASELLTATIGDKKFKTDTKTFVIFQDAESKKQ